jgi:DNA-binding transcriptional MerR regulator
MKPLKQDSNTRDIALDAYKNDAFDNGFYQYFKERKGSRISEILNSKERKVTFKEISYKMLNDWEKAGLIDNKREGSEWRRFSIMDAIWLKIIQELRAFGMSLKQIKVTKESLEFQSRKCGVSMPLLEFYTAFTIANKMPVLVLVFNDGVAIPANYTQYKVSRDFLGLENHIQLSLNNIIQGFFPDVDLKPTTENQTTLSIEEVELLAFMRVKVFEKIEVKYKGGKMDLIEGMESVSCRKRIDEILKEQKYASIELIEEDGQVTRILRKIKKKL